MLHRHVVQNSLVAGLGEDQGLRLKPGPLAGGCGAVGDQEEVFRSSRGEVAGVCPDRHVRDRLRSAVAGESSLHAHRVVAEERTHRSVVGVGDGDPVLGPRLDGAVVAFAHDDVGVHQSTGSLDVRRLRLVERVTPRISARTGAVGLHGYRGAP